MSNIPTQAGNCPHCGAPVLIDEKELEKGNIPKAQYTCTCPRVRSTNDESAPPNGTVLLS